MNKIYCILAVLLTSVCLTACTADPEASRLYRQEAPLEAEIIVPAPLEAGKTEAIRVMLTQDGSSVEDPEFIHMEIWKRDGTVQYGMTEAHNDGQGQYSLSKKFENEGLYYVQVHAKYHDSLIMPTKQFIVGELSESDKQALQSDVPTAGGSAGKHH